MVVLACVSRAAALRSKKPRGHESVCHIFYLDILPSLKEKGIPTITAKPRWRWFLLPTPSFRVHLAGDPGVTRP